MLNYKLSVADGIYYQLSTINYPLNFVVSTNFRIFATQIEQK